MIPDFSLVQLEYFRTAARMRSLTRAAEQLNITQPSISTAITNLERQLGARLLVRIPRKGVEPTAQGARLLESIDPLLDTMGEVAATVRGGDPAQPSSLDIGVYDLLAPFYGPGIVLEARHRHPRAHLTLREGTAAWLPEALARRQLDCALMYSDELTGDFNAVPLRTIRPHVVVSEDHELARSGRVSVSLHELAPEPAVLLTSSHSVSRYMYCFRMNNINPNVAFTSTSYEVVRSFVAAGLGYSLLHHHHLTRETHSGSRLVPLQIEEPVPSSTLCAVTLAGSDPSMRYTAAVELVGAAVQRFRDLREV